MTKLISTRTHAVLDYVMVTKLLLVPRVMGFSKGLTNAMGLLALVKLGTTLLTRHEGGAYRALPMKAHLALDTAGGATLCALPFLTGETDAAAVATCASLGLFDVTAATLTEQEMPAGTAARPNWAERTLHASQSAVQETVGALTSSRGR